MVDDLNGAGVVETILAHDDAEIAEIADAEIARDAYVTDLIAARCPELGPDDLALLGYSDEPMSEDEMIPAEIGAQILAVVEKLMDRMDRLEEAMTGGDIIGNVWTQMADCTLPEKQAMLQRLEILVESEAATHHSLQ